VRERESVKICLWTGPKSESLLSILHWALFVIHSRRTHSLQCYTALNQFSLQRISYCYNSTVIAPPTVCIPISPVWPKAFLSTEVMLPQHVPHSTVTVYISLSLWHYSRLHIVWCIVEKKCSTHSRHRGGIPELWSTTVGTLEFIFQYVVYKTSTNVFLCRWKAPLSPALLQTNVEITGKKNVPYNYSV